MATAMKSHKLRAYQRTAIESARRALTKSGSCVLQMPTGAGKTRCAAEIISTSRGMIWFVCHRREIIRQAAKAFAGAGIDFGIVSPEHEFEPNKRVQIASVQTLPNRMKEMRSPKLVIWDECHHVAAKSWSRIRNALHSAKHLGLTATPERLDGKGLAEWFKELVVGPGIRNLIDKKYLSDFRYFAPSEPDLTSAKLQAGDYKKADIAKAMNVPVLIGDAIDEYKVKAKGKRALVFCAGVEASQELVRRFNKAGIKAAHVDGTTPVTERDAAIAGMASGKIKVLSNVEVFTEGFDLPAIDAVILMRPTKSLALFLQMIGRGLRKTAGKDGAIIFDHAGLWLDHGWPDADMQWSLEGGARRAQIAAAKAGGGRLRRCPECNEVRVERVEVCSCGYEFATGREIGEFDGVLTEVRGWSNKGKTKFAQRYGVDQKTINSWITRGMPTVDGAIDETAAAAWVNDNIDLTAIKLRADRWRATNSPTPNGFCTMEKLAETLGVGRGVIHDSIKRGMPRSGHLLKQDDCVAWLKQNPPRKIPPLFISNPQDFESQADFAKRVGIKRFDTRWYSMGIPCAANGWLHITKAIAWVNELNPSGIPPLGAPSGEYVTQAEFARMVGGSGSAFVLALRRRGLPHAKNGWIPVKAGIEWMRKLKSNRIPPMDVDDPDAYESQSAFNRRLSCASTNFWVTKGKIGAPSFPHASNGWVHIQRGLEWVRDNTDIEIPDSAWPKKAARVRRNTCSEVRTAA